MTSIDSPSHPDPTAAPPPGWYPDPRDTTDSLDRWWNGVEWSGHTRRRPWTPPTAAQPPAPAQPATAARRRTSSSAAWWSLGLGLLALTVAISVIVRQGSYVWVSTSGVFAVINGIRALRARSRTAIAIAGIVTGSLGTLLMLITLVMPIRFFVSSDDSLPGGAAAAAAAQAPVAPAPAAPVQSAAPLASPAPTSTQPLQAYAPSALPDDQLNSYSGVPIKSITSASAGCGVLTAEEPALPMMDLHATEARRAQDRMSLESDGIRSGLQAYVKQNNAWPTRIDQDPQTRVLFTIAPDGSCDALGTVSKVTAVRYALSPDHGQAAVALLDTTLKVGTVW